MPTPKKPPHLLQKTGRKALPPEQHKHWTVLELRERCFVTVTDCWEWRTADGAIPPSEHGRRYPQVTHGGQNITVRRIAWQLVNGRPVPDGMRVMPIKCSNPRCQNPFHAKPVTEKAKQQIAAAQGAFSTPARCRAMAESRRRSPNVERKLDIEKARRIRAITGPAHLHCQEFRISPGMFNRIRSGKAWREYA